MLMVIKRLGKEEAFNIEKMKNTMAAASDELRKPLGSADIHNLAKQVENAVEHKEKITSKELYKLLIDTMRNEGFTELADAYKKNSSNSWA